MHDRVMESPVALQHGLECVVFLGLGEFFFL